MRCQIIIMLSAVCLASCNQAESRNAGSVARDGRYIGIGVYGAGGLWQKLSDVSESKNKKAATLADDDHIIVVVDSQTGEIRQCGNFSGYCVKSNPWTRAAIASPANLAEHAKVESDLVESEAELKHIRSK